MLSVALIQNFFKYLNYTSEEVPLFLEKVLTLLFPQHLQKGEVWEKLGELESDHQMYASRFHNTNVKSRLELIRARL